MGVILVTGSAGFIGYHTCKRLLKEGHKVIGIDNHNSYYSVSLKVDRTKELEKFENFKSLSLDIHNYCFLQSVISDYKFDFVIHLAAQAGVRFSITNPEVYADSNLVGTSNILGVCHKYGVKRLIYASSSSVYGGCTESPFKEDMNVDTPISFYAATKKSCELMAHSYSHIHGLETIGLRFFTVYGPYGRPDMMLWLFTEAIMNNKPIDVFNYGNMKRDFTYVDDIVDGIVSCTKINTKHTYEIYNLGNNKPEKLNKVIEVIESRLGKRAVQNLMPLQLGDIPSTCADISKAQSDLGYNPKISLEEGINKFIDWYVEYHKEKI